MTARNLMHGHVDGRLAGPFKVQNQRIKVGKVVQIRAGLVFLAYAADTALNNCPLVQ